MPMRELRRMVERLDQQEAKLDLRLLSLQTYLHWSGPTSGKKTLAQKQGDKLRANFMRELVRRSRGKQADPYDGYDVLRSGSDVRAWLGEHGVNAAA